MTDGDDEMKKVMLDMLFEELPEELEKMNRMYEIASWDELKAVSHKMKSTLSFVGNEAMVEANKKIESTIKNGEDTNSIAILLTTLSSNQPKVIQELKIEYSKL
ncbi:MAG: Hpt domain-containing protein [Saprospiraceae bacterium]